MPGIEEFQQNVQVQANPFQRITYLDISSSTPLAVGAIIDIEVFAPVGYVSTLENIYMYWPKTAGSLAGDREFRLLGVQQTLRYLDYKDDHNEDISYECGEFGTGAAPIIKRPSDGTTAFLIVRGTTFDATNGLTFRFWNNTDVIQTGTRSLHLWIREQKIS